MASDEAAEDDEATEAVVSNVLFSVASVAVVDVLILILLLFVALPVC